ncbi:MAG: MoaD/ThiS family protein [Candidatus Aenigmatarchaeota archaeon]
MKVKVFIEKGKRNILVEVPEGKTIEFILNRLRINPQTVIPVKNGEIVTEQEPVSSGDSLKILSIKLGG